MDLNKTYNNPKLELRRQQLIKLKNAVARLRASKLKVFDPRAEVRLAIAGQARGELSQWILSVLETRKPALQVRLEPAKRLLAVVAQRSSLLDADEFRTYLPVLFDLVRRRDWWIRPPEAWKPATHNVARQFSSLVRHLTCLYSVPVCFDWAWMGHDKLQQEWFLHVGRGGNLRTAKGLPVSLTKLMAHFALHAPVGCTLLQAIRYGQARGLGVPDRVAKAILGTHIGNPSFDANQEAFWLTVLNFFAIHAMIDPEQVGPIIDYLHHQKYEPVGMVRVEGTFVAVGPPQPGLSMKSRDPAALLRQVAQWHHALGKHKSNRDFIWSTCGIAGLNRIEGEPGNQRRYTVTELLSSAELRAEGAAMRHCVATYAASCHRGTNAIYTMIRHDRDGEQKMVTIEVAVARREIMQVRRRLNAAATPLDERVLKMWATAARLTIGSYAMLRNR
jgi:hypothetical protein